MDWYPNALGGIVDPITRTHHGSHCYDADKLLICGWPEYHLPRTFDGRDGSIESDSNDDDYIADQERISRQLRRAALVML